MPNIDSKDISVIVQGAIDSKFTGDVLKSVRKNLPEAEIILSTWIGSNTSNLGFDILVENEDPGAEIIDDVFKTKNNINRQIVSTKEGLNRATRKYSLKIRTDILLENTNFLNYFGKYIERNESVSILNERVLINSLYTRDFNKITLLFHPSDWVFFGLTEDLKNIWDIPLQDEPQTSRYFDSHPRPLIDINPNWQFRYIPEQYIWINFLKKNGVQFDFEHITDINKKNIDLSELSLVNNLTVIDYEDFGIKFLKYDPYTWNTEYNYNISHLNWLKLYKKHCAPKYKISLNTKISANSKMNQRKFQRIFKRIRQIVKYKGVF